MIDVVSYDITLSATDGQLFDDMIQRSISDCYSGIITNLAKHDEKMVVYYRALLAEYERIQAIIRNSATIYDN